MWMILPFYERLTVSPENTKTMTKFLKFLKLLWFSADCKQCLMDS